MIELTKQQQHNIGYGSASLIAFIQVLLYATYTDPSLVCIPRVIALIKAPDLFLLIQRCLCSEVIQISPPLIAPP